MSTRNDSEAMGAAFLVAIGALLAMAFFAIFAFLALIFTVLSLVAWNKPLTIGKTTIEPHEARAFVLRGIIGTLALPSFALFATALFGGGDLNPELWPYLLIGGYTLGSVGGEYIIAEERQKAEAAGFQVLPPLPVAPAPSPAPEPAPPPPPFEYASWEDEEARS